MTAQILKFPEPSDRDGRQARARRSPLRSPGASECRRLVSSTAMDWAWTRPVDGPRLLVLLALAKRVRPKTDQASPSMPELVELTGMSETTIRAHIQALAKDGIITADVSNGGRHKRSIYTLPGVLTPRELWGSKLSKTPRETTPSEPETPQIPSENPPAAAPVVLRTKREQEEESTSAAAAAADEQTELFGVEAPPPVKAGRSLAVAERKELAQANAGDAVGAWCDAFRATHDAKPTARQIGQVGRECRQLLEAGNPPERVMVAAKAAGEHGFPTVERQYRDLASRRPGPVGTARPSTTDQRTAAAQSLKSRFPKGGAA